MRNLYWCAILAVLSACATPAERPAELTNSAGKEDAASLRIRLSDANPLAGMGIRCDAQDGCTGHVEVSLLSPDACAVLTDPRCGIGTMEAARVLIAQVRLRSQTEGDRLLPLSVHTAEGDFFTQSVSVAFTALPGEEIDIEVEHVSGAPMITLSVVAEWQDQEDPGASELEAFLSSIPDLEFEEIQTAYIGYRAYALTFHQPLDHTGESVGRFGQRATLHHIDHAQPMVFYTSGYGLSESEYLCELGESLSANQLSTEQRFFGESLPESAQLSELEHVTIVQAAADHHRFVEALRPFYDGRWLSTGHSKGGMTSVYHRRFYPDDVDLTVAYVAPISFEPADPRYIPFLDSIGNMECRETVRDLQHALLERLPDVMAIAAQEVADFGLTYESAGGLRLALEDSVEWLEWGFWQGRGVNDCYSPSLAAEIRSAEPEQAWRNITAQIGYGGYDQPPFMVGQGTYAYQAALELGYQSQATAHLADLLMSPGTPWLIPGEPTTFDPASMQDIQQWVLETNASIIFLYGEYDPWRGGAFNTREDNQNTMRVVVPEANHSAMIRDLEPVTMERVLEQVADSMGVRPNIETGWIPSRAPRPAHLLTEGFPEQRP